MNGGFGTNIEIANAIRWAGNRADILSCSWGGNYYSNDIASAINDIRIDGRNGLGCIVVAASGNGNPYFTDVGFPANIDGVITVGAINNKGNIWNYSQRGSSMDVVAPSGGIPGDVITIDRMGALGVNNTNYRRDFNGTSAACPQVAGVVALMLSVNPNLTESEVRTVLQNTAKDLGASGFDNTYGYGLVDAYAAVKAVAPSISGPSTVCEEATYSIENLPAGASVEWNLEHTGLPYPLVIQDEPLVNQCTITNQCYYPIATTLTANIYIQGNLISVLNKTIASSDNSTNQTGSYYQQSCVVNGILSPTLSGNIKGSQFFYLNQGCYAEITLYSMQGRTVSFYSGYPPANWYYSSSNSKLIVKPAVGSSGVPTTFKIEGGCKTKFISFFTYAVGEHPNFFSLYPNPASAVVNLELNELVQAEAQATECRVSRTTEKVLYEIQLWNSTGILKTIKSTQSKVQIPLSGLPKGLYYVLVIKDGKTERQKLVVE